MSAPHTPSDEQAADRGLDTLTDAFDLVIRSLGERGYDVEGDENFHGTPGRAARGFAQLVMDADEINASVEAMLARTFPSSYDHMILSKHNLTFGLCPHHLLPVIYRISLAYIPSDRVIGISKLSRVARLYSRRPVLQEQLTEDLAAFLHERMSSVGSGVYLEGLHLCMAARGVEVHEARLVTSSMRGAFRDNAATRQEFLDLVRTSHPGLL